ncbi:malto-oligosyltrehalose trehalohydrolase [Prosthecomicrobium pneumaticum]|uniref:Malto-oligosyltrehalose trehalohydrolase n=1 Tax=Prosthecomicrobium pneumaticum TaxID=81895 RepID=A0A7W9CVA8_9HYPH|nr:malto-oligosyltrehalose trehalohydrolase [Prosthecomicrobium pneumaticum]MBB5752359.1 maltooligosyltrehalose trehalohydrolase [Prosthecomicrobium pneumaticum]
MDTFVNPAAAGAASPAAAGRRFGPRLHSRGVEFRLWAPLQDEVRLELDGGAPQAMTRHPDGWHGLDAAGAGPGARYRFVLADGSAVPDPASRHQPEDVHGPSEVVDTAGFGWTDAGWRGRRWAETVIYELHVGAFTGEGTFAAAIPHLAALAELGVTAIELMPIADFPGRWNWGYDGVLPFAPDSRYGRPEDLMRFVDAAHGLGLQVILDVVYNHFGPEGNYLPLYAPIFDPQHHTAWGAAVNFCGDDADEVRAFIIESAVCWVTDYHIDGLRLDAVHALLDEGAPHILEEIATKVRGTTDRRVHLIVENEENDPRWLERDETGVARLYSAQWNDDVHHALHTALTGEGEGYYGDYLGDTTKLGRALAEGFGFQGELMPFRGSARGAPSGHLPPTAFIAFLQNHDQIGNRAFGERIAALADPAAVRAATALLLLLPQIPLLFMGEEWGSKRPFLFFSDFEEGMRDAIRNGRRKEFAHFAAFSNEESRERIPDPTIEETFLAAKLDWSEAETEAARAHRAFCRDLLALRRRSIVPLLADGLAAAGTFEVLGPQAVRVDWRFAGGDLVLHANLGPAPVLLPRPPHGTSLWTEGRLDGDRLAPASVLWTLAEAPR